MEQSILGGLVGHEGINGRNKGPEGSRPWLRVVNKFSSADLPVVIQPGGR